MEYEGIPTEEYRAFGGVTETMYILEKITAKPGCKPLIPYDWFDTGVCHEGRDEWAGRYFPMSVTVIELKNLDALFLFVRMRAGNCWMEVRSFFGYGGEGIESSINTRFLWPVLVLDETKPPGLTPDASREFVQKGAEDD
jgi:hypothetical protein